MNFGRYRADLHIHSCLSPCGELEMYPRRIVERARAVGLDLIALTDHNSAGNVRAVMSAAQAADLSDETSVSAGKACASLTVIPGMEITTSEEAHIIGLFPTPDDADRCQAEVEHTLPRAPAGHACIKDQVLVDEHDLVAGYSPRLLLGATGLDVYGVVDLIHAHRGLAIASHIDRDAFSIPSQLGFIPPDLRLDAVEISPLTSRAEARIRFPRYRNLPMVGFSDAHQPDAIGSRATDFWLARPTVSEIGKALAGIEGRRVIES